MMLSKKPTVLLASYSTFCTYSSSTSKPSTSCKYRRRARHQTCCRPEHKSYATIASDNSDHHESHQDLHSWPKTPKGQACPTPYQIFAMQRTATYSKARFHELVKLYHPDRGVSFEHDIPQTVRIERYRLIVAAHTILSDPTRRSAYDRFGAGWDGRAEVPVRDTWNHGSGHPPPGPFSRSWSDPDDRIWRNATWEDWEKYYEWRAKKEGTAEGVNRKTQTPIYFSNSYFFLMVMILALMGSTANYNRAQDAGTYFVQQRDIVHDRAARELRRVRQEATTSGTRQDRVEWFLRNLEATRGINSADAEALREEKVGRLLPDREVCRSGETSQTND